MTRKQKLTGTVALAAVLAAGASFALAQSAPRSGAIQKGIVTRPGPMRPIVWDGLRLRGASGPLSSQLTESECTGLGGTVNTVSTATCPTQKGCVTADKNGVLHGACIDNKVDS